MRTLIYVPVIHTSADLGSLAGAVTERGIANLGEDIWKEHQRTIEGFWDGIMDYFSSVDATGMKIYQDGMVAEGEVGTKIVEECVKSGSRNYELVSKLLKRGAILIKTENLRLLKEEHERLLALTQAKSILKKLFIFMRYKFIENRLLNKRDNYIAQRIEETLGAGEKGILFIGAFHNIINKLPESINIIEIKNVKKVKEYQLLLPFYHKHRQRFDKLSKYLKSPLRTGPICNR